MDVLLCIPQANFANPMYNTAPQLEIQAAIDGEESLYGGVAPIALMGETVDENDPGYMAVTG